jgi:signal transduction histidine kinase
MRNRAGLGLGLFICKEIVSAHHGNIWAESVHGAGSTFHLTLPAKASDIGSDQASRPDSTTPLAEQADTLFPAA